MSDHATTDSATRFIVRFRDEEAYFAAQAVEANNVKTPVASHKRRFISVEIPSVEFGGPDTVNYSFRQLEQIRQHYGAEIIEDYQFDLEAHDVFDPNRFEPDLLDHPSLDDVVSKIRADAAWATSRGRGVTIAIVDTGINGTRQEFPVEKRAGAWQALGDQPWTDRNGHGTMCATIAAATRAAGGAFDGIAPEADLIACKTRFFTSELVDIYDYLTGLANQGMNIVASNSFGVRTGSPPPEPPQAQLFQDALNDAIAAGVTVVFSAGNYHELAGGDPDACSPTSIWLYKCRADVLTVATCDLDDRMWYYSSRGPGQYVGQPGTSQKPDLTAPTPAHGRIVWNDEIRSLPDGWGTSGACPQVAGLAALIRSHRPGICLADLQTAIRSTATPMGHGDNCEGAGLINCKAAIDAV